MNRRTFVTRIASLAAVAAMPLRFLACAGRTTAQVIAEIQQYVALGKQAFTSVVAILTGNGVMTTTLVQVEQKVLAAFDDITAAVTAYLNAPASGKATLLGAISTALQVAENELQTFWADLNIPDPKLLAIIQAALVVIISTIQGYIASLPPAPVPAGMRSPSKRLAVTPKRRTPAQFKADFNKVLKGTLYEKVML